MKNTFRKLPQRNLSASVAAALTAIGLHSLASAADFTVHNLADSGQGSLRQAVLDANAQPGADRIQFADGLLGKLNTSKFNQ